MLVSGGIDIFTVNVRIWWRKIIIRHAIQIVFLVCDLCSMLTFSSFWLFLGCTLIIGLHTILIETSQICSDVHSFAIYPPVFLPLSHKTSVFNVLLKKTICFIINFNSHIDQCFAQINWSFLHISKHFTYKSSSNLPLFIFK